MAYTENEKSTGLDVLTTLATGDLHIVGDVSDSGRAKAITQTNLETVIANSSHFVDELVANNYFTTELAGDSNFITELQTAGVGASLEVEENGVSVETGVSKINIISNGGVVTNPVAGEVDIDLTGLGGGSGGTKLAIDTTQISSLSGGGSPDKYTVPIPGGTLGTNDAIRFKVMLNYTDFDGGGDFIGATLKYGGTTIASVKININAGVQANGGGFIEGYVVANNTTNDQKGMITIQAQDDTITENNDNSQQTKYGIASEDSSISQDLEVILNTGTNCQVFAEGIIVEKISSGGNGGSFSEQNLGGIGDGIDGVNVVSMTSELDGSVVFITYQEQNNNDFVIVRFEKDINTGFYRATHKANQSSSSSSGGSMAIIGSYLYVARPATSSNLTVVRFDKADLTNDVDMTESPAVTTFAGTGAMFTDGTDLFIKLTSGTGTWTQYTISGTTLTSAGTITGGLAGATSAWRDASGNVYMVDNSDALNTVSVYTYTGTFTLTTSDTYGMLQLQDQGDFSPLIGTVPINSTVFYLGFIGNSNWYTGSDTEDAPIVIIKPFTKPV